MMYRYLLFVRFILLNIVAFSLLTAAFLHGWLDGMMVDDIWELCAGIFAVFVYGLILCGSKIWRTSVELNDIATGAPAPRSRAARYLDSIYDKAPESRATATQALRLKLSNRIAIVRHIANALVFLGLVGTVIGFIIALSGVDPAKAADVDAIAGTVATLIIGMSVALYTTLVGAVLYIWLIVNHRMLASGTINLITNVIELGENRGRA